MFCEEHQDYGYIALVGSCPMCGKETYSVFKACNSCAEKLNICQLCGEELTDARDP